MTSTLLQGDALSVLATLAPGSIQTVITSPPYYGLRKYTNDPREIGQEPIPDCLAWARREPPCGACYVCALRAVFAAVWRVLRDDGTVFLNLGDSYAGNGNRSGEGETRALKSEKFHGGKAHLEQRRVTGNCGLPEKNLLLIPARVALALQSDGWIVRSDIIWAKNNCMPESVTDRPTRAHEYVYLLSKSARYYYDADAIREPHTTNLPVVDKQKGGAYDNKTDWDKPDAWGSVGYHPAGRNKRSVWTIATRPYSGARDVADYVGDDGKPYRASADCPMHSHLAKGQSGRTQSHDVQPDQPTNRNADTLHDPALSPPDEPFASSRRATDDLARPFEDEPQSYSFPLRTIESSTDHKTSRLRFSEDSAPEQTHSHTTSSYSQYEHPPDSTDYSRRASLVAANGHSTESHKTARALSTNQPYSGGDQTADDTPHTPALPASVETIQNNPLNRIEGDSAPDDLFSRMGIDIAGKESQPQRPPLVSMRNGSTKNDTCTCEESQVDHFATMPEALIEPCLLAGSSAQACEHCGAAWGRAREKIAEGERREVDRGYPGNPQASGGASWRPVEYADLGFAPRCACANNTGAASSTVLDCFAGTGTVLRVAERFGRDAIGIELNPDYSELSDARTNGVQKELFT